MPPPQGDPSASLQLLVTNLDYSDYLGRLAVGRIVNGTLYAKRTVGIAREGGVGAAKVGVVYSHEGLRRVEVHPTEPFAANVLSHHGHLLCAADTVQPVS